MAISPRGYFYSLYYQGAKMSIKKGWDILEIIFIERLKGLMKERGLNQVKLAKEVGVKQNTISSWVCGKKEPSITSLWLLADFFEVNIDYLVGRESD